MPEDRLVGGLRHEARRVIIISGSYRRLEVDRSQLARPVAFSPNRCIITNPCICIAEPLVLPAWCRRTGTNSSYSPGLTSPLFNAAHTCDSIGTWVPHGADAGKRDPAAGPLVRRPRYHISPKTKPTTPALV